MSTARLDITLDRVQYVRTVVLQGVPRVGDIVELSEGGWSETVTRVWWYLDSGVPGIEFRDAEDTHREGLADSLLRSGWEIA